MKEIKRGDYFLLPYRGRKRDLLVKAWRNVGGGYWRVVGGNIVFLPSCVRVSPSRAKRILRSKP